MTTDYDQLLRAVYDEFQQGGRCNKDETRSRVPFVQNQLQRVFRNQALGSGRSPKSQGLTTPGS